VPAETGGRLARPARLALARSLAGGGRVVTGLGPARLASSSAFWRTLSKDLGIKFPQSTSQPGGINP
jgi:hypothetical protein